MEKLIPHGGMPVVRQAKNLPHATGADDRAGGRRGRPDAAGNSRAGRQGRHDISPARAARGVTRLLGRRTPPARVFGLLMTRDAVDVVEACLRHHLGLGVERVLVVDNGSTDGTFELLQSLSGELPLDLRSDDGPFQQGHVFTRLAH